MREDNVLAITTKSRLKKIGDKYFLPFETWNYFDFAIMLFFIVFAGIMSVSKGKNNYIFIALVLFYLLKFVTTIKDRFFIEIKTTNSFEQNVALIKDLAQRQNNFTESLDEEGLFLFEYLEKNVFYRYKYRKRDYTETVVVYCEKNSIWVNSYNQRYLGIFKRYNLKQWIKLIQLKTKATN